MSNCKKFGHYTNKCCYKNYEGEKVNFANKEGEEGSDVLLFAINNQEIYSPITWFLDSHAPITCGRKDFFM